MRKLLILSAICTSAVFAQPTSVTATAKGPNQINLTWVAPAGQFYGYVVEIQSAGDSRYSSFTVYRPIPVATGYTCNPSMVYNGVAGCPFSDPSGAYVYNPVVPGIPTWVTEAHYTDPQDDTAAQIIITSLKKNTAYSFRVRTYTGNTSPTYGAYSSTATATTANYVAVYVNSTTGSDSTGNGTIGSPYASITMGVGHITCGYVLIVQAGNYPNEYFNLVNDCSAGNKQVIEVEPGSTAVITGNLHPDYGSVITIYGSYNVIDGLTLASTTWNAGDYDLTIAGPHNALLNMKIGPDAANIPSHYGGVAIGHPNTSNNTLVYGSYIHDFNSPWGSQNNQGNGGFIIGGYSGMTNSAIWSNHFTRSGHDTSFCDGCSHNKWLNNISDGGWGMAFEMQFGGSNYNLLEGWIIYETAAIEGSMNSPNLYKPAFEVSADLNTVRRNIAVGWRVRGAETSGVGWTVNNNLLYHNVLYSTNANARCYFQSSSGGSSAYDGTKFINNICNFIDNNGASEVYWGNTTAGAISHNSFFKIGGNATDANVEWFINNNSTYRTVAYADANFGPAWVGNAALAVAPQFVDPANMDFHLAAGSPLRNAGVAITDPTWPWSPPAGLDLGVFLPASAPASSGTVLTRGHSAARGHSKAH